MLVKLKLNFLKMGKTEVLQTQNKYAQTKNQLLLENWTWIQIGKKYTVRPPSYNSRTHCLSFRMSSVLGKDVQAQLRRFHYIIIVSICIRLF